MREAIKAFSDETRRSEEVNRSKLEEVNQSFQNIVHEFEQFTGTFQSQQAKLREKVNEAMQRSELSNQNMKLLTHSHTCLLEFNRLDSHLHLLRNSAQANMPPGKGYVAESFKDNQDAIEGWSSKPMSKKNLALRAQDRRKKKASPTTLATRSLNTIDAEDSILKAEHQEENHASVALIHDASGFDSIHSAARPGKEDLEALMNRSIAQAVDETLVSYRGRTYKRGNLLLVQNHLLQRCEELVSEVDFDDDCVLKADQVFKVVHQMCGLAGRDSKEPSPGSPRGHPMKKDQSLKKTQGTKVNASNRPAGNLYKKDVGHGASLPSLKRNVAFENHTFFVKNRPVRLGVHGHNKTIVGGETNQYTGSTLIGPLGGPRTSRDKKNFAKNFAWVNTLSGRSLHSQDRTPDVCGFDPNHVSTDAIVPSPFVTDTGFQHWIMSQRSPTTNPPQKLQIQVMADKIVDEANGSQTTTVKAGSVPIKGDAITSTPSRTGSHTARAKPNGSAEKKATAVLPDIRKHDR